MPQPITFVSSAPGKLILAGEHSVVHRTRALATVIDKRTYCQFDFVPAPPAAAASSSDATSAASAAAAPEAPEPRVTLNIVTSQLRQTSDWSFAELAEKARTLSIPTTFDALRGATLDSIKQSLRSLNHTDEVPPQVFLLFYFVLLRGGQPSAPHTRGSLTVTIESQLPMSAGLGSSAAYTSSLSAGFVWLALQLQEQLNAENAASSSGAAPVDLRAEKGSLFGESCSCPWKEEPYVIPRPGSAHPLPNTPTFQPCVHLKKAINAFAFEGEKIIHGNPSGVDNTCAVFGGIVVYRKDTENEFLTNVPRLNILVVNTRIPRDTKKLVAGVGALRARYPRVMQPLFDAVDAVVGEWLNVVRPSAGADESVAAASASSASLSLAEVEERVGQLMRINQGALDAMGVGHPHIHRVLRLAAAHGFDAGKLTGAGGGGCVIILQPSAAASASPIQASAAGSSASVSAASARAAARDVECFTSELRQELGCDYLETVVGQAGVWIRSNGTTLRTLPELQADPPPQERPAQTDSAQQVHGRTAVGAGAACSGCPWRAPAPALLSALSVVAAALVAFVALRKRGGLHLRR